MYLSAWTYPWDVARLGVDAVLEDLAGHGMSGIDLAATYHPISAISPRGEYLTPFFSPSGAVFFPARPERYGRIAPAVWPDAAVVDVWPAVAGRAAVHGLELNAWTICLFQPWMAQRYPETARSYVTGQHLDTGVCLSNADVQAYLTALVSDLVDQFPVGVVKLEGIAPPRFDYGWTRRRVYAPLGEAQVQALSACFCAACREGAAARGVDVAAARTVALEALSTSPSAGPEVDELLAAYTSAARSTAAAWVRDLATVTRRAGVRLGVATPVDGMAVGLSIEEIVDAVDVVLLAGLPEDRSLVRHVADVLASRDTPPSLEYFLHPPFDAHSTGSIPTGIKDDLADPHWNAALQEALALGTRRLSLYNYGLLTEATFSRLVEVAKRA